MFGVADVVLVTQVSTSVCVYVLLRASRLVRVYTTDHKNPTVNCKKEQESFMLINKRKTFMRKSSYPCCLFFICLFAMSLMLLTLVYSLESC